MPNLQSSGLISLNDIKALFGGPASPSLANYFRGGSYIPATKQQNTLVTAGPTWSPGYYEWRISGGILNIIWLGATILSTTNTSLSSYTTGGVTYTRGQYMGTSYDQYNNGPYYAISRTTGSITNININTGIPGSGNISLSQFYGAEKP